MRSKVQAAYARGKETEARILNVAVNLFGTRGFDSVSTREIADAASVPPASLRYYFKNKRGLYVACLLHIQTLALQRMEPALQAAEELLQESEPDTDRLIDVFCTLQEAQIDNMIGGPDANARALFMIRHDLPSDAGASNFKGGDGRIAHRMMTCFIRMTMVISGNSLDAQSAMIVAGLINGQLTIMSLRRDRLAEIGWDITPERLLWLKRTIRFHSAAILRAHSMKPLSAMNPEASA